VAESWIQGMNRCTGPAVCYCSIVTGHQADNERCPRNAGTIHKSEPFTLLNGAGETRATHFVNERGESEPLRPDTASGVPGMDGGPSNG
jgi:hypothetical protein